MLGDLTKGVNVTDPWSWLVLLVVSGLSVFVARSLSHSSDVPTVNSYKGDFTLRKAHAAFISNARQLIKEGAAKYKGPFRIITTLGYRVVLPSSYAEWVRKCPDVDHISLVAEQFFASYPGFESIKVITDPRHTMVDVTTTKLSQNIQCQRFEEHITPALHSHWGSSPAWHPINWSTSAVSFTSLMSASMFVGPSLSRNPAWQSLTIAYAQNLFLAARALRSWPALLRPLANLFLPACRTCRSERRRAQALLRPFLAARADADARARAEGREPERHHDTVQYMQDTGVGAGVVVDAVDAQLAFAVAALHTTTQLLKQVLLDIAAHPGVVPALREEVEGAVAESGWTAAGLAKMRLLDSVVKESQRLKPGALVNLERRVVRDTRLPDGRVLPRGTLLAVDSSCMWEGETYERAGEWDGWRALRRRETGGKESAKAALVSSSEDHFAFGMGKPICPGRFFVAHEIKVAVAKILMGYDVRLEEGYKPVIVDYGFEMLADLDPKVEVRRRS